MDPDPIGRVNSYWEVVGGRLENVSDFQAEYDVQILGAGNVRSTPVEALAFVESAVRGDLLSADSRAQMRVVNPHSEDDDGYGYGLGLARRVVQLDGEAVTLWGHTGGDVGAGSFVEASLDEEFGLVGITNVGMFLGGPLGAQFDERLLADLVAAAR